MKHIALLAGLSQILNKIFKGGIFMEIINLQKQREKIKRATYSIEEVAKLLGVSYKLASKLVHSKGFPKIQIGRRILIPKDLFWEWLKNNPEIKI